MHIPELIGLTFQCYEHRSILWCIYSDPSSNNIFFVLELYYGYYGVWVLVNSKGAYMYTCGVEKIFYPPFIWTINMSLFLHLSTFFAIWDYFTHC